jgi:hypothetical protein
VADSLTAYVIGTTHWALELVCKKLVPVSQGRATVVHMRQDLSQPSLADREHEPGSDSHYVSQSRN